MGAITQAMAAEARHRQVKIETNCAVEQVIIERGRARGVIVNGEHHAADFVVANVNPRLLYQQLIPRDTQDQATSAHFEQYQCKSGTFRLNVALSRLPEFTAQPDQSVLEGGIILAPDLNYMATAFEDARTTGFSKQPIVEMLIPSLVDSSLAPAGQHVASLFCQHFDPRLKSQWETLETDAIEAILGVVEAAAPGFKASILAVQSHSPWALEQKFGLLGGDIFHGRLSLDQLFSARPMLGMGQYQSDIDHLYLCGAGTHPGGGVSGIPGMNAAREIIRRL
jgi:phytoene dehydrogenase-like protein